MDSRKEVQHVYLVGAKSLGAYGGYETFVYKLTEYHQNKENIKYHVACKANGDGCMDENKFEGVTKINDHEFELHNAHCFKIDIPQIGPAQAIYYDVAALKACCEHIRKNHIPHPIVYIMACRIGPFAGHFYKEIHKLGGKVYLNPDGHEWMRAKWSAPIRKYWKISEQMMVKYCDLAICDSVNIEKYIHECYDGKGIKGRNPKTTFIAYGADLTLSKLADNDEKLVSWYKEKGLTKKNYYLVVGRFVPENSFEVMIREFMKSNSQKDFALITNVNDKFLNELEEKLHFKSDDRIKFVGTVYDQELLKKIRENAYAYFHGHTVGGTNPSLIEALGSTDLNLLVDVGFNKEVAEDCALYWSRKQESLAKLIDKADQMSSDEIAEMGRRAKKRVAEEYTWDKICGQYEDVFTNLQNGVIVYYIDITDEVEIMNFIKEDDSTTVEIELRDLKSILDDVVIGDYAEFHAEEIAGGYAVAIDKFMSDRVLSKIAEFNQKAFLNSSAKKPYKSIEISEEGLELIEFLSLDCTANGGEWHSDSEIKIDKNGYVIVDGNKTKEFWDGYIRSTKKPLRLKIRNICGDETVWEV